VKVEVKTRAGIQLMSRHALAGARAQEEGATGMVGV